MDDLDIIKRGRRRSDKWQDRFIADYKKHGNLQHAAEAANVARQTVYNHQRDDPAFNEKCEEAYASLCGKNEVKLLKHVEDGNLLALFSWLRANMPEKYRENNFKIDQTITHDYVVEIGTPRVPAITEHTTDTIQDVTPFRMYETTGDILE
jgi:hypothetical protein